MNPIAFAASTVRPDFVSLHTAIKYVAGAYILVMAVILIYFAIMAVRQSNNQKELAELRKLVEEREAEGSLNREPEWDPTGKQSTAAAASEKVADELERAAEAIRSEHQL